MSGSYPDGLNQAGHDRYWNDKLGPNRDDDSCDHDPDSMEDYGLPKEKPMPDLPIEERTVIYATFFGYVEGVFLALDKYWASPETCMDQIRQKLVAVKQQLGETPSVNSQTEILDCDLHLSPPQFICSVCGRKTWNAEHTAGQVCNMTQPSGLRCAGVWRKP